MSQGLSCRKNKTEKLESREIIYTALVSLDEIREKSLGKALSLVVKICEG